MPPKQLPAVKPQPIRFSGWRKFLGLSACLVVILALAWTGCLTEGAAWAVVGVYAAFAGSNAVVHRATARLGVEGRTGERDQP